MAFILATTVILAGCSGTFEPPSEKQADKEEVEPAAKPDRDFAYEPLGLDADNVVVPEKYTLARVDAGDEDMTPEMRIPDSDTLEYPTGAYESYRIQLFTSKEYGPAFREQIIAQEVFDKRVWLDYEVPYYKVRVGNFFNRSEADRYLPAAREAGYKTAWVVKVNTNVKQMEDIYDAEMVPVIDSLEKQFMNQPEGDTLSDSLDYEPEDIQN